MVRVFRSFTDSVKRCPSASPRSAGRNYTSETQVLKNDKNLKIALAAWLTTIVLLLSVAGLLATFVPMLSIIPFIGAVAAIVLLFHDYSESQTTQVARLLIRSWKNL